MLVEMSIGGVAKELAAEFASGRSVHRPLKKVFAYL
jgi:hypothetical protein